MAKRLKINTEPGPRLQTLMALGHIKLIDSEYVGIASDGTEVNIGDANYCDAIEIYLANNSTPEEW